MKIFFIIISILFASSSFAGTVEKLATYSTHDGYEVRGKFSYPAGAKGLSPGVLLIHGSGALDMNMWLPGGITADGKPSKMFEIIAQSLSKSGAVVFRYNKRGVTDKETGAPDVDINVFATADVSNLIEDVKSALDVLKNDPSVDPNKIILLGISEGTILAPIVSEQVQGIAGLVLLSSVGQSMRDIMYFQQVERSLTVASTYVDINHDGFLVESEIGQFPELSLPIDALDLNGDKKVSMAELKSVLLSQHYSGLESMLSGPFKSWFEQNFSMPANFVNIVKYKNPILMLHGEIDAQTPLADALLISQKLKQAGHTDFQIETFPGLGHGFSPHKGPHGITPTVGPIEPTVVDTINQWINSKF